MSWDACLIDDRGHVEGDWNYTHNCNVMANAAMDAAGIERLVVDGRPVSWWRHIAGMTGPDGASVLHAIIGQFDADPDWFRAMNPENGWGDFDSFRAVLVEMRNRVPEWPTRWGMGG